MGERKSTEERREEILDEALEIIHEKGQEALTMGEIADRIGVSEPAVYRHFDSKKDIVIALAEKVFQKDRIDVDRNSFDSFEDLLEAIMESIFSSLEEEPYSTALLFHEELFREYPEVREMFDEHRETSRKKIINMVEDARERGEISSQVDSEAFTTIFAGAVRVSVLEWRASGFEYSLTDEAEKLSEELGRGL